MKANQTIQQQKDYHFNFAHLFLYPLIILGIAYLVFGEMEYLSWFFFFPFAVLCFYKFLAPNLLNHYHKSARVPISKIFYSKTLRIILVIVLIIIALIKYQIYEHERKADIINGMFNDINTEVQQGL